MSEQPLDSTTNESGELGVRLDAWLAEAREAGALTGFAARLRAAADEAEGSAAEAPEASAIPSGPAPAPVAPSSVV